MTTGWHVAPKSLKEIYLQWNSLSSPHYNTCYSLIDELKLSGMSHFWTYINQWCHSRCFKLMWWKSRKNQWNQTLSDWLQSKLVQDWDSPSKCWEGFLQGFLRFCWHSAPIPPALRTLTGRRRWLIPEHNTYKTSSTTSHYYVKALIDLIGCSETLSHQRTPRQTEHLVYFWDLLFSFCIQMSIFDICMSMHLQITMQVV